MSAAPIRGVKAWFWVSEPLAARTAPVTPFLLVATFLLSACVSNGSYESRSAPAIAALAPASPPASFAPAQPPAPTGRVPSPGEHEGQALLDRLLPASIANRSGWSADILAAFSALRIPLLAENLCAAIAVIEQESSFQADPVVPGLSHIAWQELEKRRDKYGIPKIVLDLALSKTSADGRSYRERIDSLRTERQMSVLYDDLISAVPAGRTLLSGYNPVRTGGPMQVSVAFAEEQTRSRPYPFVRPGSLRDEVFTRRGGVYFGIAMLLDYPASYSRMLYRFADFNAGRYSSRNAAFQAAVARLSGRPLALDGDLLRYQDGVPMATVGNTERALSALQRRLDLDQAAMRRDLALEKSAAFEQTRLYRRLFAVADAATGEPQARERLPQIELKSPKISRRLTTEWFARRVDTRYRACLERKPLAS